jgi:hypothetical protein
VFFEKRWTGCPSSSHSPASGNPVRNGDGYATVTGYELPQPLVHQTGKAGARFQPEVRISARLCSSRSTCVDRLLRQEKDEASPFARCARDS